jgi:glycine/D-amino acid oxidase-like deaminating enzyme
VDPSFSPSIEATCYWFATRAPREARRLLGTRAADVAIVGAGFTGLWTALFLKELDSALSIVILEQGVAGYGGTGRNAGIVGETIDHSHELAARHFGFDEAKTLARIGRENLDDLERFLSQRGIDAEFERTGQLIVALTAEHAASLRASVAFAHRLGLSDWRYLEEAEAKSELSSPLYRGAALAPRSGTLHPVKLVDGLAGEARRLGVEIFERTPVTRISTGAGRVVASTPEGTISADRLVLATNAYTHALAPRLLSRFLPLYDYIVVSDPLTREERRSIGWERRQGVTDARAFFNYYRLTADGRVLFGTSEAAYHRGNRVDPAFDRSPPHSDALRASFARHFPQLAGLRFPYAWGGPICSTTRLTPFFGSARGGRISYALGYTGHGIGSTRLAGRILAHRLLGRSSPLLDLAMVRRKPIPFPPEPFRSLAVSAVTRSLRRLDATGEEDLLLRVLDRLGIGLSS